MFHVEPYTSSNGSPRETNMVSDSSTQGVDHGSEVLRLYVDSSRHREKSQLSAGLLVALSSVLWKSRRTMRS